MLTGVTLQNVSIFLQLVAVKRQNFVRRIIRLVLNSNYLQTEEVAGNIHVGALLLALGFFFLYSRARIYRDSNIAHICFFAHMNATDRRLDIYSLTLLAVVFHIHGAARKQ